MMLPDLSDLQDDEDDEPSLTSMRAQQALASALAPTLLAGPLDASSLRQRATHAFASPLAWLPPLCLRLHYAVQGTRITPANPRLSNDPGKLADWLNKQPEFQKACAENPKLRIRAWLPYSPPMQAPPAPLAQVRLPQLATPGEIADWLGISPEMLDGYANLQERAIPANKPHIANYRYRWQRKSQGNARLIEAPKPRLRALQRHLLNGILDRIPPHPAAQGCVRHRSAQSYAARHTAYPILIKLDCRDFFTSISFGRIRALFLTLGYPTASANCLAALCTHRTPRAIQSQQPLPEELSPEARQTEIRRRQQLDRRHLPQGAPTSPALANLCAFRLDTRLSALARQCGGSYSRYVDDIALSLNEHNPARARRILHLISDILLEEGFTPNWRKARIVSASQAQQLCGLTINEHVNTPRQDYEQLKAILHNCRKFGPDSQNHAKHPNFRAHLLGRIAWHRQSNPNRAQRLQASFEQINWEK